MPDIVTTETQRPLLHGARPPGGWWAELRSRMQYRMWLKFLGVSAFMWIFFIGYFHVLRHPGGPVATMPLTAIDGWVAFQPGWLGVYLSLWLYVGIAPGIMRQLRQSAVHGAWAGALCLTGLACFYAWPTAVPAALPVDLAQNPAFALLQGVDAPGNACPSLHVATAMFSAIAIHRQLLAIGAPAALRWSSAAWFLAIAFSTLAVKQHVVLDVAAGALLGAVFGCLSRPRPSR